MTSIGFDAGYGSIFGDGNRVELDLCEPCLRDTLGTWLRVKMPADTPLATMLAAFKPELHGGEFPPPLNPQGVKRTDLISSVQRIICEGAMTMEKKLFYDLAQSMREAQAISKGTTPASRRFEFPQADAKAVREKVGLSQDEFARMMRVSTKTLQNWEQHRRKPCGPAAALLKIMSAAPDLALKTLHVGH